MTERPAQLTGAAKLLAEADEEERELARQGGRRYIPRGDVAADDSPWVCQSSENLSLP